LALMLISSAWTASVKHPMYLVDTNVISEARKKTTMNGGVAHFFR
jgi:hypothetical protein